MASQVEQLIDLQTMDLVLRERNEAIDALERRVADLESQLAEQRGLLEACRSERAQIEARRRDLEGTLAAEESKMKDRRMRLNRIRNEKEAAAVRREIEVGKEENQKLEEELMTIFEQVDTVSTREREIQQTFDTLEQRRAEEQTRADEEISLLSIDLDDKRRARESLAKTIEDALRRQYETISMRRRGLAVVEVRGGSCQGCHMRVAPQLVNDIQRNQGVVLCPSCHRILYVKPQAAGGEE